MYDENEPQKNGEYNDDGYKGGQYSDDNGQGMNNADGPDGYKRYNGYNNGGQNNGGGGGKRPPVNISLILMVIFIGVMAVFFLNTISRAYSSVTNQEITYNEFLDMLEEGKIESLVFTQAGTIQITPKESEDSLINVTYWTTWLNDDDLMKELREMNANDVDIDWSGEKAQNQSMFTTILVGYILPIVIIYLIFFFIMRRAGGGAGGGIMGMTKSNAKVYVQKQTGVNFHDVAGQDEAKESLVEIVDFLHNPGRYSAIGAKLPKGALLVGPPGTGKTLLARAVAGEGKVPFISISGSDFVEMFVGVGAKRVRELFKQAAQLAPCIIFIDEIDAIGKSRDSKYSGNDEREQTLNQLLSEMDGFDSSKAIFILAATNRPEVLDKALLRPGRFDRRIIVDKPDLKGREEVLKVHSRNVMMDETVDLHEIALATSGAVGADLANMINEAAIIAVKANRRAISQKDLFEAVEIVIAGKEKKDRVLNEKEKKMVAYHEVGHALVSALDKNAEPVQKITIVPRTMGALGYTMQVPEEERYLHTYEELRTRIVTFFGGRAAEEVVFGTFTGGAANDMERATQLARSMISQLGMSKKFGLMSLAQTENEYLDGGARYNCSDKTLAEVDEEIRVFLAECYEEAKKLMRENREALDEIAGFLLEKETITGKEFMKIFNKVKGIEPEESEEPEEKNEASEENVTTGTNFDAEI